MKAKPLHWVDRGPRVTLCGCETNRCRYIGPWSHDDSTLDLSAITCDPCRARLAARRRDAYPSPQPVYDSPAPVEVTPMSDAAIVEALKPGPVNLSMLGSLGESIQAYVDARARELATEIVVDATRDMAVGGAKAIDWTVNREPFAKLEGTHHKALPELLHGVAAGDRNFLVVGPAGSGKTTLAHNLADALSKDGPGRFGMVCCTGGMSESALTGRAIPDLTTGKVVFQSTGFVEIYEGGGVFLLDEVDAADPNVLLVINAALANGHLPLPNRTDNPTAVRHPDCVIICAANTWGHGADRQYVGRNQLDAAFLDRFVGAVIEVDYDRDLESALVGDPFVCARVWQIRDKVAELKLRRIVGTRFLIAVARRVKARGQTLTDALKGCTVGWTSDERAKVGVP